MNSNNKVKRCKSPNCTRNAAVARKGMCNYCYAVHHRNLLLEKKKDRPKIKRTPIRKISPKQQDKMRRDRKLWNEIWKERPHVCENAYCRTSLERFKTQAGLPISHLFSHRRTKAAAPELRYDKKNIDLLCPSCHREWETGDRSKIKIVPYILPEKRYVITQLMVLLRQRRRDQGCRNIRPREHEPSL